MLGACGLQSRPATRGGRKKLIGRPRELFAYRLAAALGVADVAGLMATLTTEQVEGWMAYDLAEPLGVRGLVSQMASMLAMFAASNGVESSTRDYLPGVQAEEEQTEEQQRANARRIAEGV